MATQNIISDSALDDISGLPVMEELETLSNPIELNKAIYSLACGKAPSSDGISAEALKSGKHDLPQHL